MGKILESLGLAAKKPEGKYFIMEVYDDGGGNLDMKYNGGGFLDHEIIGILEMIKSDYLYNQEKKDY